MTEKCEEKSSHFFILKEAMFRMMIREKSLAKSKFDLADCRDLCYLKNIFEDSYDFQIGQ